MFNVAFLTFFYDLVKFINLLAKGSTAVEIRDLDLTYRNYKN